jgi:class 3 adenylate cyclase
MTLPTPYLHPTLPSIKNYLAQMIKRISKNGGDICKFAGDAIIVLWPIEETMDVRCVRAAQCALEIHECLDQLVLGDGISLRCKIGIGAGNVDVVHIGGVTDSYVTQRMEYVALGDALVQSFHAENHSSPALTIVSEKVYKYLVRNDKRDAGSIFMCVGSGCISELGFWNIIDNYVLLIQSYATFLIG